MYQRRRLPQVLRHRGNGRFALRLPPARPQSNIEDKEASNVWNSPCIGGSRDIRQGLGWLRPLCLTLRRLCRWKWMLNYSRRNKLHHPLHSRFRRRLRCHALSGSASACGWAGRPGREPRKDRHPHLSGLRIPQPFHFPRRSRQHGCLGPGQPVRHGGTSSRSDLAAYRDG